MINGLLLRKFSDSKIPPRSGAVKKSPVNWKNYTPESNIAPEKQWLQDYLFFWEGKFSGANC